MYKSIVNATQDLKCSVAVSLLQLNTMVLITFVQTQNYLEVKKYALLLYMGINMGIRSEDFDVICTTGLLRITDLAAFGTKVAEDIVKWIDLSAMHQFGDGLREKTPSILSLNLIPLGDLSGPSKVFSQDEINLGFFLISYNFCTKVMVSK
jgi:hypothetical protein